MPVLPVGFYEHGLLVRSSGRTLQPLGGTTLSTRRGRTDPERERPPRVADSEDSRVKVEYTAPGPELDRRNWSASSV